MDIFYKNRILILSLAALLLLNVGLLATLWWQQLQRPLRAPPLVQEQDLSDFIRKELDLDDEQVKQFDAARTNHLTQTSAIRTEIHSLKKELMDGLNSDNPDTLKAKRLAQDIGLKEAEMELLNFHHFFTLKSVCRPEQQPRLQELFRELLRTLKEREPRPKSGEREPQIQESRPESRDRPSQFQEPHQERRFKDDQNPERNEDRPKRREREQRPRRDGKKPPREL